jgi:hypothetical protein
MLWSEFPFMSLVQNGLQRYVPQHLDIKFRTITTYEENVSLIPVQPDTR